jgi:hypothetical protein
LLARRIDRRIEMLTLYFTPGACSLAAHIVLEESGEKYQTQLVDLVNGEQRSEPYLRSTRRDGCRCCASTTASR